MDTMGLTVKRLPNHAQAPTHLILGTGGYLSGVVQSRVVSSRGMIDRVWQERTPGSAAAEPARARASSFPASSRSAAANAANTST